MVVGVMSRLLTLAWPAVGVWLQRRRWRVEACDAAASAGAVSVCGTVPFQVPSFATVAVPVAIVPVPVAVAVAVAAALAVVLM